MNINPVNMQADIDHWLIGRDELEKRGVAPNWARA